MSSRPSRAASPEMASTATWTTPRRSTSCGLSINNPPAAVRDAWSRSAMMRSRERALRSMIQGRGRFRRNRTRPSGGDRGSSGRVDFFRTQCRGTYVPAGGNPLNSDDSVENVFESNYGEGQDSRFGSPCPSTRSWSSPPSELSKPRPSRFTLRSPHHLTSDGGSGLDAGAGVALELGGGVRTRRRRRCLSPCGTEE